VNACGIDDKLDTRHEYTNFKLSISLSLGVTVEIIFAHRSGDWLNT